MRGKYLGSHNKEEGAEEDIGAAVERKGKGIFIFHRQRLKNK